MACHLDTILILATANPAKAREMARLLEDPGLPAGLRLRAMTDYPDMPQAVESGDTFADNSLIKARTAARHGRCWAIADDSGLEVLALDGDPGVNSARYAGRHGDDEANNRLLLERMAGLKGPQERRARFVAAVAIAGPDGRERVVHGYCEGYIAPEPRGGGGFGYDPLFVSDELGVTLAEAAPAQKDSVSHRGRAFALARDVLREIPARAPKRN